jgi:hypothetical protein
MSVTEQLALEVETGWRRIARSHGATRYRLLDNGVEVLRTSKRRTRGYWAFRGGDLVGRWGHCAEPGSPRPSGHILGNYARVQDPRAEGRELAGWLAAIAAL